MMDQTGASPAPRLRMSVRAKIFAVFVPLIVVLGVLLALATIEAGAIHRAFARVTEEDRESELTGSLLVELRGAEAWATRSFEPGERAAIEDDLLQHLDLARALVRTLNKRASGSDPSEPGHEAREQGLRGPLLLALDEAAGRVRGDDDWTVVAGLLADVRRNAEVLGTEARNESRHAATDLDRSVHSLVDMMFLVAVMGLVTLLVVGWTFRRWILRPLAALREAAVRLGRGQLDGRVNIHSRDEFGQVAHAFNDMAEILGHHRAELESRVDERTRELFRTARLADLGTLAAGIAHEINNPLASIAAGVEGLHREMRGNELFDREAVEYIELVLEEVQRAREIASRLLQLGRREDRRQEPVWLAREVGEVVAMLSFKAKRRRIGVDVDFAEATPPLQTDPTEWRQVFFNLLRNALAASPDRGRVTISAAREGEQLVMRVRDEGPGFPDDDVDRVFEPFFTTKPVGEGTGLGLAIVDRIVREHGGSVHAVNWERGGEVRIELPWPEAA